MKILTFLALFFAPVLSQAMPGQGTGGMPGMPMQMPGAPAAPHAPTDTGVIEGTLFVTDAQGKKAAHPTHPVVIMVFQNGQRILMLDKATDEKGHFVFKNIFSDPSYTYAVGSMVENSVYVLPDLRLKKGEKKITVDFTVGPGSPYLVPSAPETAPQGNMEGMAPQANMGGMAPSEHDHNAPVKKGSAPYQKVAIGLSLFVLFLGYRLYRAKKAS